MLLSTEKKSFLIWLKKDGFLNVNYSIPQLTSKKQMIVKLIMSESYNTNEFEFEVLERYFNEFIRDRVYFNIRTLAIDFISDNTSLNYKQASSNDNLRGTIMRFSKIITRAKREETIKKYNANTYKVIKNIK